MNRIGVIDVLFMSKMFPAAALNSPLVWGQCVPQVLNLNESLKNAESLKGEDLARLVFKHMLLQKLRVEHACVYLLGLRVETLRLI